MAPLTRSGERRSPDLVALAAGRAAAGDLTAVHFLYTRFVEDVIESIRDLAGGTAAARDTADSVFADLPRAIQAYEPRELSFAAWLRATARAAALERAGEIAARSADDEAPVIAEQPGQTARASGFSEAVWHMPSDQREVLVLRHIVGLSTADIASRLGTSEAMVRVLLHRACCALRAGVHRAEADSAVA